MLSNTVFYGSEIFGDNFLIFFSGLGLLLIIIMLIDYTFFSKKKYYEGNNRKLNK